MELLSSLLPPAEMDSALESHNESLLETAQRVFGEDMATATCSIVRWRACASVPGAFTIYLMCPATCCRESNLFFQELISYSLVPGHPLRILSSRNVTFKPPAQSRFFFFSEILVHIEKEKQLELIEKNLPSLAEEIRLGSLAVPHSRYLLEMKRVGFASKNSYVYERILALMQRYPKQFQHDIFNETQRFLVLCRDDFRKLRPVRHLARIISSFYLFRKTLEQDVKVFPSKRHLYLKLMQTPLFYPFGLKRVLGMTIALNSLREYECFEQRHILRAISRIVPGVRTKKDSFLTHKDDEHGILTVYIEAEKTRGEDFTLDELKELKQKLPAELKNSIEYLTPSLFVPRNEEELYRNIVSLSQELRYVHDLPQAIISFQEQRYDLLKFNVILLRLLTKKSQPLQELVQGLPPEVHFLSERVAQLGMLRKKYTKEANVFSLEIASHLFLRKNHSVDLVRARQYVVKVLEMLVGPFRDFNGGFLHKQNEQLESIQRELGEEGKAHELLLENLFYSLTPSIMQTLISPESGKQLCSLFLKMLEVDLDQPATAVMQKNASESSLAVVVKGNCPELKESLTDALKPLALDSFKCAVSALDVEGNTYVCYLYLNPTEEESKAFLDALEGALTAWKRSQQNMQVVRLYLPRATQSLDPRIGTDRTSGVVIKMLYEGLMRLGKEGKIEPALAEDVAISHDWKRYTFTLKETFWSNGTLLTAYDFEYAWKKFLEPDFPSIYSFLLFSIKNAEAAKRGEKPLHNVGIRALNERTLFVELEYPAPYFLSLTAHWTYAPLCRDVDQRHPGWAYHSGDTYVCNGPFKLDVWKLNDDLAVVKNPFYWDAHSVKLDRVQISIIEDDKVAVEMFKRGELDWIGDPLSKIPLKSIPYLKKRGELHTVDRTGFYWLQVHLDRPPFHTAKLRRAFALAVNRKKLIDEVLQSDDEPALGFYRRPVDKPSRMEDGDVENARRLFAEALSELKLTVADLPTIVISHSDLDEQEIISHKIGLQWEEAFGVKVKYERLPWNSFFEALNRQEFMAAGLVWYSRYDDPLYYLDLLVYREYAARVSSWKNGRFRDLIEGAKHETSPERRELFIEEAEKVAIAEMPLIPLFFQKHRYAKNPRLKNVFLSDVGQIDLRQAYLENQ